MAASVELTSSGVNPMEKVVLAIVGMGICWSGCSGVEAFKHWIYRGKPISRRVTGGLTVEVAEGDSLIALEDMIASTVSQALTDAGLGRPESIHSTAVLSVSCGANHGNLAKRISSRLELSGPSLDQIQEEYSLNDSLQEVRQLIEGRQAEAVVLVNFDLAEGAVALVVLSSTSALQSGLKPYALILSAAECSPAFPEGIATTCLKAFSEADLQPDEISYLEVVGPGNSLAADENFDGMLQAYQQSSKRLTCGVGQLHTNLMAAGLAKAAICLSSRFLPGHLEWERLDTFQNWIESPFYFVTESKTWFADPPGALRRAAVGLLDAQGNFAHIILTEAETSRHAHPLSLAVGDPHLILLTGNTLPEIMARLEECQTCLRHGDELRTLTRRLYYESQVKDQAIYCLALIGRDAEEILREADFAMKGAPAAFDKNSEWQTPSGSYFTPDPQGPKGKIAFVYPGAFNSTIGLGRDLFYLFPELHDRIVRLTSDIGAAIREKQLYPRSLRKLTKEQYQELEARLAEDPVTMLTSGTGFAVLYTFILREIFAIHPGAAFGYSLGENSLMYACGVWGNADEARRSLEDSPLFRSRLAGRQEAICQFWGRVSHPELEGRVSHPELGGIPIENEGANGKPIWINYLLMARPQEVQEALVDGDRVYLTHINTPRQVVIGGDPEACRRVIAKLGCTHLKMPYNHAMHCQPVRSEYTALYELHHWAIQQKPGFPLYLSADCQPVEIHSAAIADKIATGLCTCVDFAGLTRRVYDDGVRIFIELGAGSNCSKWIDDTLRSRPHLSVAINRSGVDDLNSIVRLMARLSSHQVTMDLARLFTGKNR
jgi:acyl transferase domain-containing protein